MSSAAWKVFRRKGSLRSVAAEVFVGEKVPVIGGGVLDPRKKSVVSRGEEG
jgi:hypothetical protein